MSSVGIKTRHVPLGAPLSRSEEVFRDNRSDIERMFKEGRTRRQIGAVYGVPEFTAQSWKQRLGLVGIKVVRERPEPQSVRLLRENIAEVERMRQEGCTIEAIGARFGLSRGLVARCLRKIGVELPREAVSVRVFRENREEVERMCRDGYSFKAIGARFGYSFLTARNCMKILGIPTSRDAPKTRK
jgi:transposase